MSDCRIVLNEQTGRYRIERRHWWGWSFVMAESGEHYATFDRCEDARDYACRHRRRSAAGQRRWRVVDLCARSCPSG